MKKYAGRNTQMKRQWSILLSLSKSRYVTIPRLAQEFGVVNRTIRRDLDALEEVGFPMELQATANDQDATNRIIADLLSAAHPRPHVEGDPMREG